ncbi:hypothetical protein PCASD_15408 [Puccinia coronata f. sp. avenae]|uniref:Uncharacterized protein n=1 Tax=Puccinia coronata f. sp. avenae TaxID=200324 RepID=A0A2N5TZ79_9BASI|nr:hypothetical protein PCASD_15408 [Puccinia coronata f. sp. avenae]
MIGGLLLPGDSFSTVVALPPHLQETWVAQGACTSIKKRISNTEFPGSLKVKPPDLSRVTSQKFPVILATRSPYGIISPSSTASVHYPPYITPGNQGIAKLQRAEASDCLILARS